jgi:hypothetical protein
MDVLGKAWQHRTSLWGTDGNLSPLDCHRSRGNFHEDESLATGYDFHECNSVRHEPLRTTGSRSDLV